MNLNLHNAVKIWVERRWYPGVKSFGMAIHIKCLDPLGKPLFCTGPKYYEFEVTLFSDAELEIHDPKETIGKTRETGTKETLACKACGRVDRREEGDLRVEDGTQTVESPVPPA